MRRYFFFLVFFLSLAFQANAQFGCEVQDGCGDLPVSGGPPSGSPTFFCEGETVTIVNTTNPALVDITIVCWGDGNCDTIPGPPQVMTHFYDFPADTCLYTSTQALTLAITMTVINQCPEGVSENCIITFVKIKVDPVADFTAPDYVCAGEPAIFNNETCENADTATYQWYVDGVYQGPFLNYTHPSFTPGPHQIMLIAENECGQDTAVQSIYALGMPVAEADFTMSPANGCAPVTVSFENLSQGPGISCLWSGFPPGVMFLDTTSVTDCEPIVTFPAPGVYTISLTVDNGCFSDAFDLVIEVLDEPEASLAPVVPSCEELFYTPSVAYGGTIDSWQWVFENGVPATSSDSLPANIYFGSSGSVTLIVSGPCGTDTLSQPVTVLNQDIILTPVDTVCSTADPFSLQALPQSIGSWSGPGVTPGGVFTPSQANEGVNVLVYTITFQNCTKADSMEIFVQPTLPVDPGPDESLCQVEGDYFLPFSPPDGVWSGNGITDSLLGVFNTQVAGAGAHLLLYEYTDPLNGCVTTGQKTITVVPTPSVEVADTTYTCATPGDIDLNILLEPVFTPQLPAGQVVWSGNGVSSGGIFNSGGVVDTFDLEIQYTVPPGCDTTVSLTLILSDLVDPEAGLDMEVCQNEDTLMLVGEPFYPHPITIWSGPEIDPETGKIDLNALTAPGTYVYTYTIFPGTPCQNEDQVVVELFPGGGVTVPPLLYACVTDGLIDLPLPTPPPPAGTWSGEALVNGDQVDIQNLAVPVGSHPYTYTVPSLPDACNAVEAELIVEAQPVAAFSNEAIGCVGAAVDFQNNTTGADLYFWNFGDGQTSTDPQPSHPYSQAGNYDITLEVHSLNPLTNQPLCTHIATGTIHIIDPPDVAFVTDVTQGCGPLDVTIDNQSQGEGVTYTWNWGAGPVNVDEPGTLTFPPGVEDTTYTIVLSAGNQCDTLSDSVTVTVLPVPDAAFGVTNNQPCSGMYIEANNTSTGNPAENFWYLDGVLQGNTLNLPPFQLFTGNTPTDYLLLLVTQNECGMDSAQTVITAIPTDVAALFNMSDTVVCVGDTLLLTAFATPGAEVHWNIPNVGTYGDLNQVPQVFDVEGIYEIILYAEGCGYDSMSRHVTVLPLPELNLLYDLISCENEPVSFQVVSDAPGHLVDYGDGFSSNATLSEHAYAAGGIYPLQLTATSAAGCTNTWTGTIEIVENPIAAFVPPQSVCANVPVTFTSQTPGADQCIWDFGDGPPVQGCTIAHTYSVSGVYPVTLVVISEEGCRDTTSGLYQVQATPVAFFTYTILEECTPGLVVFEDASTGSFGTQWSFGGNQPMEEEEYPVGGVFPVTVQAVNGDCVDTYTDSVEILQGPSLEFEIDPNCTVKEGSNLVVSTSAASDWVNVSGNGYGATGNYHPNLEAGTYLITAQALNGCEEEVEALVLPPNEIYAQLVEDSFDILLGQIVNLQLQYNQSGLVFQWTPPDWLSDPAAPDPQARPFETVSYLVAVSDTLGCVKYDTAFVRVREDRDTSIYLPNAFTPDHNGFNDVFMVRSNNPGMFQVRSFLVYDIDGALVFESRECQANVPSCGWDGQFRGKPAYQGVYRWQYELEFIDGQIVHGEGTVMLLR